MSSRSRSAAATPHVTSHESRRRLVSAAMPRARRSLTLGIGLVLGFTAACGSSGDNKTGASAPKAAPADVGHVSYVGDNRRIFRVEARPNGRLEDVSAR